MKTYFTKYLPVEGEIQEGDWITDDKFNIGKCLQKDSEFLECSCFYGMTDIINWRKLKLFLCSRDIKVGDKYWYIDVTENNKIHKGISNIIEVAPEPDGHLAVMFDNNTFLWIEEVFKVVGEISLDALSYVKEGDEFDEDDVYSFSHNKTNKIYSIKGSCGHFH